MNYKVICENLGLEEDEYIELLQLFVETGNANLQRLQTALSELDWQQVVRSAHTLKGASGNLGLTDIHQSASQIERHAAERQIEILTQQVQLLAHQMKAVASNILN